MSHHPASESLQSPSKKSKDPQEKSDEAPKTKALPPQPRKNIATELPKEPEMIYHAFDKPPEKTPVIGNEEYYFENRLDGTYGHYQKRELGVITPTYLPLSMHHYEGGIMRTLTEALTRLLRNKGYQSLDDISEQVEQTVNHLTQGCLIMTYLKIRSVNRLSLEEGHKFLPRPKIPEHFEIPTPFALAIQHLGIVKVSSLTEEIHVAPTMDSIRSATYGLSLNGTWSVAAYNIAVEFAKSVGMQFSTVDTQVKLGSSWWLFEQYEDEDLFELRCRLPEDNYTEQTAAVHLLWCTNVDNGLLNPPVTLDALTAHNYGAMVCNPPVDANLIVYFGIEAVSEQIWSVG